MLRILAALLIAFDLGGLTPADVPDKTDAQILKMGSKKWAEYCVKHTEYKGAGRFRSIVEEANDEYCDAAKRRNAKLLASPGLSHRQQRKRLSKLLPKYADTMMSLYQTMGGNNFMDMLIAEQRADAQDAIYAYLHPKGQKRPKPRVVSDVSKLLDEWQERIDKDNGMMADDEANQKLATAKTIYREIVLLVSRTTDRAGSDHILDFCAAASALEY